MTHLFNHADSDMARREFTHFEAVSAMVPVEGGGYNAAIAVKALGMGGAPRFHKVLDGQVFKGAVAAAQNATPETKNNLTHETGDQKHMTKEEQKPSVIKTEKP